MLFVSESSIVGNTILKGHMHRYEWRRDIDSGTAATRKAPLVNERTDGVETHYFFGQKILRTLIILISFVGKLIKFLCSENVKKFDFPQ